MLILDENNEVINTDEIAYKYRYGVLSFKDFKNPDYFFPGPNSYIEEFNSASITLYIGDFEVVMPMSWSILCSDFESVESIPLTEVGGRDYHVFVMNPIDGYTPHYFPLRTGTIFPSATWTAPPIADRDMVLVPLGKIKQRDGTIDRGPVCSIFSPNRIDINKPISDIW